jgi:opacity protein-like surface antigen
MKTVSALCFGFAAAVSVYAPAHGQEINGWYVGFAAAAGRLDDANQTVMNAPFPGSTLQLSNSIETGGGGLTAIGRVRDPWRFELEYGQQNNDSDSYTTRSPFVATLPQDGSTDIRRLMANAYFAFRGADAALRPYLGLGVGRAEVSIVRINAVAAAPAAPPQRRVDFDDTDSAWQAIAGLSWRISPQLDLSAQYRWWDRGDAEGRDLRGERVVIGVAMHNLDLGLRYKF